MESAPEAFKPRTFGQIIGDSFNVYGSGFVSYIGIAAVVILPLALCSGALWALGDFARTAADGWSNPGRDLVALLTFSVGTLLLSMLAYPLMYGALIHATEQKRLEQSISIREAYLTALRNRGRLIGTWLAVSLLIFLMMASLFCLFFALLEGFGWLYILTAVLAIGLPFALYFTIKWLFVLQTVMLEGGRLTQSLRRSSELVAGNWWRAFGIWALFTTATAIAGSAFRTLLIPLEQPDGIYTVILQVVFPALLFAPLATIAHTLLYFDLRARREQYISQIMGGGVGIPPAPGPEYSPQVASGQIRPSRRLRLKPALIVIAVAVMLVGVITPTVLYFHNRADAGDIEVFVKRLSTGKEVGLGHGKLKTFEYTDFAFVVEFDGSVQAGEQGNTVEIVGSDDTWSDGLARVRVYAEQGSKEEFYAPVQYDSHLPEDYPRNELGIRVEILDEHHILVSPVTGQFPSGSQLVIHLDFGGGSGWCARMFTR